MAGLLPTRKVKVGGASGAVALVVLWIAGQVGLDMTAEVGAAIAYLITLGGAYLAEAEE